MATCDYYVSRIFSFPMVPVGKFGTHGFVQPPGDTAPRLRELSIVYHVTL